MKYVLKDLEKIKKKIIKSNFALLLDFDLTLSPLTKNPKNAILPDDTRVLLQKLSNYIHIAIITGRSITDIKKRVGIKNIWYIGNHGLEYNLNKKHEAEVNIPASAQKALLHTKKELIEINKKYSKIIFEDKKYSVALGYRLVKSNDVRIIESLFQKIQSEIRKEGILETRLDKKTFEVRVRTEINKGTACLLILKNLQKKYQKKLTPIYIGDSETDEDAFKALNKYGITIRVGKSKDSFANYYLHNTQEVKKFLAWILSLTQ